MWAVGRSVRSKVVGGGGEVDVGLRLNPRKITRAFLKRRSYSGTALVGGNSQNRNNLQLEKLAVRSGKE